MAGVEELYKGVESEMRAAEHEFFQLMAQLKDVVGKMSDLYDRNNWLNDRFDIASLIPMSLDEWVSELQKY